jgi:itaconate CoA-transferase
VHHPLDGVTVVALEQAAAGTAAGLHARSGTLTARHDRERTGQGAAPHIAMLEPPRRTGARHPSIAPYGPFPARDGQVFPGLQNEREWTRFPVTGRVPAPGEPTAATRAELQADSREASA